MFRLKRAIIRRINTEQVSEVGSRRTPGLTIVQMCTNLRFLTRDLDI